MAMSCRAGAPGQPEVHRLDQLQSLFIATRILAEGGEQRGDDSAPVEPATSPRGSARWAARLGAMRFCRRWK